MLPDKNKVSIVSLLLTAFLCYSLYLYVFLPRKGHADPAVSEGKMLWQKYNCGACHQVYGLGGYLGPDLTNIHSTKGPDYTRAFMKIGTDIMPNFNLSDQEINFLLAYLKDIDASGEADPRTFIIENNGTIGKR